MRSKPKLLEAETEQFHCLRSKSSGWILLLWCSSVRVGDSADVKLEQLSLYQEQNVPGASSPHHLLPTWMPCTGTVWAGSVLWQCTSTARCLIWVTGNLRATPGWWHADTHHGLKTSATLQGIFRTAVILFHDKVQGQANFCSVKNLAFLRSH